MKTIIVAVDFSDASLDAAHYAASLANIFSAELIVAHAFSNPLSIDRMDAKLMAKTGKELQEVLEDFMQQNLEIIQKKFTVRIRGIVEEGPTLKIIQKIISNHKADVLVMGMKGKGASSSVLGSTAVRIMPEITVPVLVIPSGSQFESLNTITLASDYLQEADTTNYDLLRVFAHRFKSLLQVVNVHKKGKEINIPQHESKLRLSRSLEGIEHRFFSIEDEEVDEGIEDFLKQHPSQLLVMLARRRNVFRRFFGTVHTRKMAYETEIPLLVLAEAKK